MKKIVIIALLMLVISGCGPVSVQTIKQAPNKNSDQIKMDGLTCSQESLVTYFPFLFGLGPFISRSIAKDRYSDCMEAMGYVVDRDFF